MPITIRNLGDADRERLKELHGYEVEQYIDIPTTDRLLPTPTHLRHFIQSHDILCSWVRAGVVIVCVKIGSADPAILSLDDIRHAMRNVWISASLHRSP